MTPGLRVERSKLQPGDVDDDYVEGWLTDAQGRTLAAVSLPYQHWEVLEAAVGWQADPDVRIRVAALAEVLAAARIAEMEAEAARRIAAAEGAAARRIAAAEVAAVLRVAEAKATATAKAKTRVETAKAAVFAKAAQRVEAAKAAKAAALAETSRTQTIIARLRAQVAVRDQRVKDAAARTRNLKPVLKRLQQIRRQWPDPQDMTLTEAAREIQEVMALVPPGEL